MDEFVKALFRCSLTFRMIAFCACTVLFVEPVSAGIFSVTPVRIYMTANERAAAVTVTNEGDEELVMQADIYDWSQSADGMDQLSLSADMIMSPPVLKIAPKSYQVVRLISLNGRDKTRQHTYRMIIREIPELNSSQANMQLQIAYAFSIPIFVTPPGANPKLDCFLVRVAPVAAKAVCQNTGSATAHASSLQISNDIKENLARQDAGRYILPGTQMSFYFNDIEALIPAGTVRLLVLMNDGSTQTYDSSLGE